MSTHLGFPAPVISPTPDAQPFWDAARLHELLLPYCPACDACFFYPRTLCPGCGSRDVTWATSTGLGHIYTFSVQHHTSVQGLREALPFVTVMVELDDGPRLMSILTEVELTHESIGCGMPVRVAFIDQEDGQSLPVFRPRNAND